MQVQVAGARLARKILTSGDLKCVILYTPFSTSSNHLMPLYLGAYLLERPCQGRPFLMTLNVEVMRPGGAGSRQTSTPFRIPLGRVL
jgi:hypothetical protein